tara:strand:- start:25 stop:516 length:492 start_codon:yes stop_codon:yes gene_type:complete
MHIELLQTVDHQTILKEANSVKVQLKKGWGDVDQIGLQGYKPNQHFSVWKASVGKGNKLEFPENYFKYELFNLPLINSIIKKYNLKRTRIMKSDSKTCLTRHQDMSKRVHIPVITNPDCFMTIEDKNYFLEPGNVYLTNTTLPHTAVNASKYIRIHIVGCLYD